MNALMRHACGSLLLLLGIVGPLWSEPLPKEPLGPSSRRTGIAISEIQYHPEPRPDGLNAEFIELYNSNPFFEDLSGWQLAGDIQFTFPPNTVLGANAFLIVAPAPKDIEAVYGITNVVGGWTSGIPNKRGHLQLLKRSGGIVLELTYSDQQPWPVMADGFGPSLVLSRPTYGEADPRAWSHSQLRGGSPGRPEPIGLDPLDALLFNEVLSRSKVAGQGFIELYNPTTLRMDLSGCVLFAGSATNAFHLPPGTQIAGGAFLCFTTAQLGFELPPNREVLALLNPTATHVYDAIQLDGQSMGVSVGRTPDGVGEFRPLEEPTPCLRNEAPRQSGVVINEIMFKPPVDVPGIEFLELYNSTDIPTNIGGWRFIDGIDFVFPPTATLPARGYVVVAKNPQALSLAHGSFPPGTLFGPYAGNLSSSGERVALGIPEVGVVAGQVVPFWSTVDEVRYGAGGRWGRWTDGGGSSLELIHPRSDHLHPSSWANSDESLKSKWTSLQRTQVLTMPHPSVGAADQLQAILFGAGEVLLDDVVVAVNGQNRIKNPSFETNTTGWVGQGTHKGTGPEIHQGFKSGRSLRISASDRGDQVANRVRTTVSPPIALGSTTTLKANARWLRGDADLLLRLRGGFMEVAARLPIPKNLGTPGRKNSRSQSNVGPHLSDVQHFPIFPATNQPVRVTVRVTDPDGVESVTLKYRFDPAVILNQVAMLDDGTGGDEIAGDHVFTAMLPGRPKASLTAFRIEALDRNVTPTLTQFPEGAPLRECLVRVGEPIKNSGFGTYHLWFTSSNQNYWAGREKMSNEEVDATFIYGTNRIVYNAGARYAGSYYTVGIYDSPVGALCGYDVVMPGDQTLLGEDHFTLDWPIRDNTDQREQLMYWMCEQLGLPNMYRRYVNLYVNGAKRGDIYDDIQQPDGTTLREFFPADSGGMLVKTDCWDEFADNGDPYSGLNCVLNTMEDFRTIEGERNLSRYRWNWRPRAVKESAHDFSPFFELIDAVNAPTPEGFITGVSSVVDMEQWMRTFAMNDVASYWDGFGNPNSKNTYLYKPEHSGWKLMSWDFDVGLGVAGDPTTAPLFDAVGDPGINRIYATPAFLRPYWTALHESLNTFFVATNGSAIDVLLNAKYAAFKTNGIALSAPTEIKSWIGERRAFLLSQLKPVLAPFAVTFPSGSSVTVDGDQLTLSGTAPPDLATLRINGQPQTLRWANVTNWSLSLVLTQGINALSIEALNRQGLTLSNGLRSLEVISSSELDPAAVAARISEVLLHPLLPGSTYIEVQNTSSNATLDLSGWKVEGVSFVFPSRSYLPPGGFGLIVGDRVAFAEIYGWQRPVLGSFNALELSDPLLLRLIQPASGNRSERVIDQAYVASGFPWPAEPEQTGISLRRIDSNQDGLRSANWAAHSGILSTSAIPLLSLESRWKYEDSGRDLGDAWHFPGFDDGAWREGTPVFYNTPDTLTIPKTTLVQLTNAVTGVRTLTHYFRGNFILPEAPSVAWLRFSMAVDDGAVFYLNGQEVLRRRLAAGPLTASKLAAPRILKATMEPLITISVTNLVQGTNLLAAEVHQAATNDTDVIFSLALSMQLNPLTGATPGASNDFSRNLAPFPTLWLTEVAPGSTPGALDRFGEQEPWVELFNSGTEPISLANCFLSSTQENLQAWRFPPGSSIAPGAYRIVWLDGQPEQGNASEWHANFRIPPSEGLVLLSQGTDLETRVLDALNYSGIPAGESFGQHPSGSPAQPRRFAFPSPGAKNNPASRPVSLRINEWMASNTRTLIDSADGGFDDWFEIYNPGEVAVDLEGFSLTDNPALPGRSLVPAGFVIPARGYLLVWADQQPEQTQMSGELHVDFKLSAGGEQIALFDRDGRQVDAVVFKKQTDDMSQGRAPDGHPTTLEFFVTPTPGSANASRLAPEVVRIIDVAHLEDGSITLTWSSRPGSRYRVLVSPRIEDPSWSVVGNALLAVNATTSLRDSNATQEAPRFYRVELQP